jgi:hypothetical protein
MVWIWSIPQKARVLQAWSPAGRCNHCEVFGSWRLWPNQWIHPLMDSSVDGSIGRWWDFWKQGLLEEVGPRGMILGPLPSSFSASWTMKWAAVLHYTLSAMMLCLTAGPRQQGQVTTDWKLFFSAGDRTQGLMHALPLEPCSPPPVRQK